jgi:hypothetical protein
MGPCSTHWFLSQRERPQRERRSREGWVGPVFSRCLAPPKTPVPDHELTEDMIAAGMARAWRGHGEGMARAWRGMAKPDHVGLRRVRAALTIIAAPRSRIGAKTPRQAAAPRGHPNDRGRIGWIVANLGVGVVRKRCFPLRPVSPVPPLLPLAFPPLPPLPASSPGRRPGPGWWAVHPRLAPRSAAPPARRVLLVARVCARVSKPLASMLSRPPQATGDAAVGAGCQSAVRR